MADGPAFVGADLWQLYEISWLDARGVPQMAEGRLVVPCDSPSVCESKSLKLYLLSLNEETFESRAACAARIEADVAACVGAPVSFAWGVLPASPDPVGSVCLEAVIGTAPFVRQALAPARDALRATSSSSASRAQQWHTHVFRSLCPVTGQPDWASLYVYSEGASIDAHALFGYLAAYRSHGAMHESCIEQIFCDVMDACQPKGLCVDARFLRRGGIDINPLRASRPWAPLAGRPLRQ